MQEVRKSQNRNLRPDPGWSINSGEDGMQFEFRRLSSLQASEGSSKLLWPKGLRDVVTLRVDSRQLSCDFVLFVRKLLS